MRDAPTWGTEEKFLVCAAGDHNSSARAKSPLTQPNSRARGNKAAVNREVLYSRGGQREY